jgi:hypothetical protein
MESNWAAEHLQVIRTLMERSAVYRRALAPIMIFNGVVGLLAAAVGRGARVDSPRGFILYWAGVAFVAVVGSFLLVRRQALKESEVFWSPPTRRITQAMLPPIFAGLIVSAVVFAAAGASLRGSDIATSAWWLPPFVLWWLPLSWVVLYGCAFHAAGFFMPRGMKIFGWAFVVGGCGLFAIGIPDHISRMDYCHGLMGTFFGGLHLAYGVYLYFTEKRRNEM